MTSRRDVNRLTAAQQRLVTMAQAELAGFFATLDLSDPKLARDALLEVVPLLVREYGDLAATAAAEWYENVRPTDNYTAMAFNTDRTRAVEGSVRYAAGHLFGDDPEAFIAAINGALQRHIRYAGRDTVARNASHDPWEPRYARVPRGTKTCAWCILLASRGWVYHSKQSAGDAGRGVGDNYHDDCDCEIVVEWDAERAHLEGYDPDAMYDQYLAARAELEADGIPITDEAVASRMRDMYPNTLTDGRVVPSLLTEQHSGWPETLNPVSPGIWRHILKRHGADGVAHTTFGDRTPYEISVIMRKLASDPDVILPHHRDTNIANHLAMIDGKLYVLGTQLKDGRATVRTAFPVSETSPIMEAWHTWNNKR